MASKDSALRKLLVESFNLEEFRTLCYDLSIDYDELPGESKTAKCRELIAYLRRRDRLDALIMHLETSRADLQEELTSIKLLPDTSLMHGLALFSSWQQALLVGVAVVVVLAIVAYLAFGSRPAEPVMPTASPSPTSTLTPTATPTPVPPFITDYVYEIGDPFWGPELVELDVEPGILPSEVITGFLRLSRLGWVLSRMTMRRCTTSRLGSRILVHNR